MQSPGTIDWKKRLRPKAYAIGVYVVAFFILVEIVVLGWAFWMRQRVVLETEGPALVEAAVPPADLTVPPLPAPTFEARLPTDAAPGPESEVARLNDEAREFRRNGDFSMAEAALAKAVEIDPRHPLTLTNLAMLEEARGNNAAALGHWRQVLSLGDRARDTIQLARERSVILEERLRLEQESRTRGPSVPPEARRIVLESTSTRPDPLPAAPREIERDFIFRVGSGSEPLQPGKLKIQVYFYEKVGGDRLVTVPIRARFASDSPSWNPNGTETLRVNYTAAQTTGDAREFYGYLLRVFYDGALQDERAEPASLLRLNPVR